MKIKMRITNFKSFSLAIANCEEAVRWLDGSKVGCLLHAHTMDQLKRKYSTEKQFISIWLSTDNLSDYYKLLSCTAWDV